jgi:hypothetical protein
MANQVGAKFVCVRPAKAVELKDGFARRVTPESSMEELLSNSSGFSTHTFELAAFGIFQPQDKEHAARGLFHTHVEEDQCVAVVGRLDNAQALRETHLPGSGEMNDAVLIGKLYRKMQHDKHKYAFVSELKGEFVFALYSAEYDACLAARDSSGKYTLMHVDGKRNGHSAENVTVT